MPRVPAFLDEGGQLGALWMGRLRGYANWNVPDLRIIVVIDRDGDDCVKLKDDLASRCSAAGVPALCRIAIEELEASFLGDVQALRSSFRGVPAGLANRRGLRDPDAVAGGTWEALERVLQRAGHYPTGMPKVEVAGRVAEQMDVGETTARAPSRSSETGSARSSDRAVEGAAIRGIVTAGERR